MSAVAERAPRPRPRPRPRRSARASFRRNAVPWLIVAPFAIVLAFPFYWMVITTFKKTTELYQLDRAPFWWHDGPHGRERVEPLPPHAVPDVAREHARSSASSS